MPYNRERLAPAKKATLPPQVGELIVAPFHTRYSELYKRISLMCHRTHSYDVNYRFTTWAWGNDKQEMIRIRNILPSLRIPKKKLKDIVW